MANKSSNPHWVGRGDVRAKAGNVSGRPTSGSDTADISGIIHILRAGSVRVNAALSRETDMSEWSNTPGRRICDTRPVWLREDSKGHTLFDRTPCGRSDLYDGSRRRGDRDREPDLTKLLRGL